MIQGAFFLACSNRSLTLAAPAPTKSSTNSEPEIIKKGTSASPATALERRVFPVPGGPTRRTPWVFALQYRYIFLVFLRNQLFLLIRPWPHQLQQHQQM